MTRATTLLLVPTLAACAALPAVAQERREVPDFRTFGEPASPSEAADIDALIETFRQAWGRQEVDALMALHADDVEWINAYARLFQSKAALQGFLEQRLFPAFDPAVSREEAANLRAISLRYLGDDAAVAHLYTEGRRGAARNAGEDARRTHIHLVLGEQEGGWRIVHTVIMDAR